MIPSDTTDIIIAESTHAGETGKNNEDRSVVGAFRDSASAAEIVTLAMVADGIGGHAAGEIASDLAVRSVYDHLLRGDSRAPLAVLEAALLAANNAIYERSRSEAQLAGMGSTAVVALLVGRKLYVAHVGDSRIYLIRGDRIQQLSVDHTWVQEAISAGLLSKEEARKHPNRHVIRRYLGHDLDTNPVDLTFQLADRESPEKMEQNQGVALQPGDKLLLCSDGLTDLVEDDEIRAAVNQNAPQAATEKLILLARQRGGFDNITIVLVEIPGLAAPQKAAATTLLSKPAPAPARRPKRRSRALVIGMIVVGVILVVAALVGAGALIYFNQAGLLAAPTVPLPTAMPTEQPLATAGVVLPPGDAATASDMPEASQTPTVSPSPTETPTETATGEPEAIITVNTDAVVRRGPDPEALELGVLLAGESARVRGRDGDGLWWYIEYPDGTASRGWVAQLVTTLSGDVSLIPVVNPEGTPVFTPGRSPTPSQEAGAASGPPPGQSATPQG